MLLSFAPAKFVSALTMYSLFAKKDNAHEEGIWTVDWARRTFQVDKEDDGQEGDGERETKQVRRLRTRLLDIRNNRLIGCSI